MLAEHAEEKRASAAAKVEDPVVPAEGVAGGQRHGGTRGKRFEPFREDELVFRWKGAVPGGCLAGTDRLLGLPPRLVADAVPEAQQGTQVSGALATQIRCGDGSVVILVPMLLDQPQGDH